jgi:hypothetical protein
MGRKQHILRPILMHGLNGAGLTRSLRTDGFDYDRPSVPFFPSGAGGMPAYHIDVDHVPRYNQ